MSTASNPFYNDHHLAFREVVAQFTQREIVPNVTAWEQAGEVDIDLYRRAAAIGLFGDGFDAEYGGHGQRDAIVRMVIMQELARAGSGGVIAAMLSNYIGLPPIQRFGDDDMKARVLPRAWPARRSLHWQSPNQAAAPTSLASPRPLASTAASMS